VVAMGRKRNEKKMPPKKKDLLMTSKFKKESPIWLNWMCSTDLRPKMLQEADSTEDEKEQVIE
jgi:hypothetical protein